MTDKRTKTYWRSEAERWEARYWELKAVAKRLAEASQKARAEAKAARAEAEAAHDEARAERAGRLEAERNIWAA